MGETVDMRSPDERLTAVEQEVKALSSILADVMDPKRIVKLEFRVIAAACHRCGSNDIWGPSRAYDPWAEVYTGWTMWCADCKQHQPCFNERTLIDGLPYRLHAIAHVTRANGETEEGFADPDSSFTGQGVEQQEDGTWLYTPRHGIPYRVEFSGSFDGTKG